MLASQAPQAYDAELVLTVARSAGPSQIGACITGDGTVAGYVCASLGGEGSILIAKPYVYASNKLHWLPLGGNRYGHVFAANSSVIVGDVVGRGGSFPAMWSRDREQVWDQAQLKFLSHDSAYATAISQSGTIWVQTRTMETLKGGRQVPRIGPVKRLMNGMWQTMPTNAFGLAGVDADGRLFGSQHEPHHGFGGLGRPVMIDASGRSTDLPTDGAYCSLEAVNSAGTAVGSASNRGLRAIVWESGKIGYLCDPSISRSWAKAINDKGHIVGSYVVGSEVHACLWIGGVLYSLYRAIAGEKLSEAVAINASGMIAAIAESDTETRLYLLTPRPR
ncbi:MAG: hypothetical protein ACHQ50_00110 [Fimbriimonadales bacterium]